MRFRFSIDCIKSNTDDVRESASIDMIDGIIKGGGCVQAYDPIANKSMKEIFPKIKYFNSWETACNNVDAVVIMTEWNEFRALDFLKIKGSSKNLVIFDLRNIYNAKEIEELGLQYFGTGK